MLINMKRKNPFISVIIPALDEENYIENCLKSVKNQDYKGNYEIIVADGMSKDKTVSIAKKFADRVVTVEKRGISAGRNAGAEIAKGKVLLFADADTIMLPNVITEVVKGMKEKKSAGVVVPVISDDIKKNAAYFTAIGLYRILTKIKLQPVYCVCFACTKANFIKSGKFDENINVAEDIDLGQRLKKIGKIVYITSTFVVASSRRLNKWGILKQLRAWPLGYFSKKMLNRNVKYPPVR